MLYYMELDREKEYLEVKECKNMHQLSKTLKLGFNTIKEYLNSETEILACGVKMPLITNRNKGIYLISEIKGWCEMKNLSYMSRDVLDDIAYRLSYREGFEGSRRDDRMKGGKY